MEGEWDSGSLFCCCCCKCWCAVGELEREPGRSDQRLREPGATSVGLGRGEKFE